MGYNDWSQRFSPSSDRRCPLRTIGELFPSDLPFSNSQPFDPRPQFVIPEMPHSGNERRRQEDRENDSKPDLGAARAMAQGGFASHQDRPLRFSQLERATREYRQHPGPSRLSSHMPLCRLLTTLSLRSRFRQVLAQTISARHNSLPHFSGFV